VAARASQSRAIQTTTLDPPAVSKEHTGRELLCHGLEVYDADKQQAGPLESQNEAGSSITEAAGLLLAAPAYDLRALRGILGSAITKIGQVAEILINTQSNAGLATIICIAFLSTAIFYMVYSIIYDRSAYIFAVFLVLAGTYAGRQYMEHKTKFKHLEVESQWINEIGQKLQGRVSFGTRRQVDNRKILMPAQTGTVVELLD